MTVLGTAPAPRRHADGPNDRVVGDRVVRFDRPERILHWVSATAVLVAVATGAVLYIDLSPSPSVVARSSRTST